MHTNPKAHRITISIVFAIFITVHQKHNDNIWNKYTMDESIIQAGLVWNMDDSEIFVGTNHGVWAHDTQDLSRVNPLLTQYSIASLGSTIGKLAIGTSDGLLLIWDTTSETLIHTIELSPRWFIRSVNWSPDGSMLASTILGQSTQIWNSETEELIDSIPRDWPRITWSPDNRRIAFYEADNMYIYELPLQHVVLYWPMTYVWPLEWSPDGRFIAGGGGDTLSVWDASTGQLLYATQLVSEPVSGIIGCIAWSPDSSQLAVHISKDEMHRNLDDSVQILDAASGVLQIELSGIQKYDSGFNTISWNHHGDRFAASSDDGHIYLWDAEAFVLLDEYADYSPSFINN